jgi:hypothetical protein
MAVLPPRKITLQRIASPDAFQSLLQTFDGLPNDPGSLYLSNTSHDLIIYVAPTRVVNLINISYLSNALSRKEKEASAMKSFLETGTASLVFFDARKTAKILFEECDIRLSNPVCSIYRDIKTYAKISSPVRNEHAFMKYR